MLTPSETLVSALIHLTDAQIAEQLNALTIQKTDSQLWTWVGLTQRFSFADIVAVRTAFGVSQSGQLIRDMLIYPGLDFSLAKTQTQLEDLRNDIGDYVDAFKAVGIWHVSPWANLGNIAPITVEDVAQIREQLATQTARADVDRWVATVVNEILNPRSPSATISQLKAAIAEAD